MASHKTLADLRTALRNVIDEPSASFWTEAQLTTYLNRAKDRVWTEVLKLRDDYFVVRRNSTDGSLTILGETYAASSFQIVAGTTEYTLPGDLEQMKLIECITSGYEWVPFEYRDMAHPDMIAARALTDNQSPSSVLWDIYGESTLTIAPKLDTTLDLRIHYVQRLADMSAETDTLVMKHALYEAVIAWAASMALRQDRNLEMAGAWEQTARAAIADALGAHARQTKDPIFVRSYQ